MDALPVEILLEIGRTDLADYHGMLNIPRFARAVTIGYRLDMMLVAGYNYKKILNNNEGSITRTHRTHKFSRLIGRTFPEITFIVDIYDSRNGMGYNTWNGSRSNMDYCYNDNGNKFKKYNHWHNSLLVRAYFIDEH